jgi:hypothetical protein
MTKNTNDKNNWLFRSQRKVAVPCYLFIAFLVLAHTGCRKLVEADAPKTSLSEKNVYSTDAAAISVLTGLYTEFGQSIYFSGAQGISLAAGLSADEFSLSSAVSNIDLRYYHYNDSLSSNSSGTFSVLYWSNFYNWIYRCNAAIEGLSGSATLTASIKKQLLGESKFLRAFFYFYLTNLYGDVPLALTTDPKTNALLARTSKADVYVQIIADLEEARELLSDKYLDANLNAYTGTSERVRPTKWAAEALLARAYLYTNAYAKAEAAATDILSNNTLFAPLTSIPLNTVFLKNSSEAIWQLQPVTTGQNTSEGALFLLPSTGPSDVYPVYLSPQLLSSFESNDQRRYNRNWVDSVTAGATTYYFPYKYKLGKNVAITQLSQLSEYLMILRLGEQYLIRAEARAQLGNIGGAQDDLNAIRTRAGLGNTTANDQPSLLAAILHERQVELFSEWGHRWFDLKRTGTIDAVMSVVRPQKTGGKPWQSWMQLYPILYDDILKNPNLTQNAGY